MDLFQPGGYFVVEAYSRSKSKVTFPYKPEIGRAKLTTWPSAAENCLKTYGGERVSDDKYLGKQTLFIAGAGNIEAVMTSRQGPDMSLTSWFAPSLGCAEVQHVATFPRKDGSLGVNAMYPITVAMGEPEQELFSAEEMAEVDPVEVGRRNIRAALLAAGKAGVEIRAEEDKVGQRASTQSKASRYHEVWARFRSPGGD